MLQAAAPTSREKNSLRCFGEYFVLPHWYNLFVESWKVPIDILDIFRNEIQSSQRVKKKKKWSDNYLKVPDDGVLGKFNDSIFETNFFYGKFTKIVSLILHNLLDVRGRKDKNKKMFKVLNV